MRNLSVTFFIFSQVIYFSQNFSGEFNSSLQSYQEDTKIEHHLLMKLFVIMPI